MVKFFSQFLAAAMGGAAGAVAYALVWQHIDRFFYDAFGIVLQCDGCHTASLSLLYVFIPCAAAVFVFVCTRVFYKTRGLMCLLGALLGSISIGGTLCLLAVQMAQGAAAALLVICITAATATAGCNFRSNLNAQAAAVAEE